MNAKFLSVLTVAAATALFGAISTPAQAASLNAGESFGTNGILFAEDTTVDFGFISTQGSFKSNLKIFEGSTAVFDLFAEKNRWDGGNTTSATNTNDWLGTSSNIVDPSTKSFTFKAGKTYSLGLESWGWNGNWVAKAPVSSTTAQNTNGEQHAKFFAASDIRDLNNPLSYSRKTDLGNGAGLSTDPLASLGVISFEDTLFGDSDKDYNDFMVTATARRVNASVPEPATLAGIALVGSSLVFSRRRRSVV
mgnify:CR=1 FL=1